MENAVKYKLVQFRSFLFGRTTGQNVFHIYIFNVTHILWWSEAFNQCRSLIPTFKHTFLKIGVFFNFLQPFRLVLSQWIMGCFLSHKEVAILYILLTTVCGRCAKVSFSFDVLFITHVRAYFFFFFFPSLVVSIRCQCLTCIWLLAWCRLAPFSLHPFHPPSENAIILLKALWGQLQNRELLDERSESRRLLITTKFESVLDGGQVLFFNVSFYI